MKLKCKVCNVKHRVKSRDEITCDKECCMLKYDMESDMLDFEGYVPTTEFGIVNEITSKYEQSTYAYNGKTMTASEWEAWAEANWPNGYC